MFKKLKKIVRFIFRNRDFVVFPSINKKEDLNDLLFKLSFMFPKKRIFYSGLKKSEAYKPDYLGDIELSETIFHVSFLKVLFSIFTFRVVLIWNCKNPFLKKLTVFPHIFNLDYKRNRLEGWKYFYAYNLSVKNKETQKAFFNFENFPKKSKCYAFGTGVSLNSAYNFNFKDGYKIICNSMIKNIALMEYIKPDFLVFADAIYHFGPSKYAFAFRKALHEFINRFPSCKILIPEAFYYHFINNNKGLKKKVFLIPRCRHKKVNINLKKEYGYHRFENILNLLILPVASTISDNIFFLGFDGRNEKSKKFWEYSKENNFIDLLPLQELAHPGFFSNRDYKSFTGELSDQTEMIMQYGEYIGKSYFCLNLSNNKAMKKRMLYPEFHGTLKHG